jgi:AsmA family protein
VERTERTRFLVAAVGTAVLIAVAILAIAFDWNWFKGPIEHSVSSNTGRDVEIRGDLAVDLGSVIRIDAANVVLGNAPWAAAPHLARADRVRVYIALWPLFSGRLRIPRIELLAPEVELERNARGEANWRLGESSRSRSSRRQVSFGDLVIDDGSVRLREARLKTDLHLRVSTEPRGPDDAASPIVANGTGRFRDGEFALTARVDSPLRLLQDGRAYRVDATVRAGATGARLHGTLPVPVDLERFELQAEFAGQDLAELYSLVGFPVPESPPYRVRGELARDGGTVHYRGFEGTIGDSDLRGDLGVQTGGPRLRARANLTSEHLDFDDLAVLVGAPPGTGEGETANARQKAEARRRAQESRLLPDRPYDLEKLQRLDADVQFRASKVESARFPIDALHAHLVLESGLLKIEPLEVGLAGGQVHGTITLDARRDPIATAADLRARGVELPRLFPRIKATSVGFIGGEASIEGRGNSVAEMLATADGEVAAVMGAGQVSNLLLELAGLDIAESLKFLIGKDRSVRLRCAYADFDVEEGLARARSMAFDTTDTVILGEGSISLRDERLDLVLKPRPKDVSPVSLRVPLEVRGTFKEPEFSPQPGPLVARAAIAAALFAVAPPAALLALIETGPGEDVGCRPAAS